MLQYLVAAIVFVVLDGIYVNLIKSSYNRQIKNIQGTDIKVNMIAAAITYIILIFGINYFIIQKKRIVSDAALLGFLIYGVYNFTNLALFSKWSVLLSIVDTMWGAVLFGLTTGIVYKLESIV